MLISLFLTLNAISQQNKGEHDVAITVFNAGTSKWPIKLSKQWFEGDTIYIITFRDTGPSTSGKTGSQGFFKFELKAFGHALNTTLTIGSNQEVRFGYGTIIINNGAFGKRYIECTFSTCTGTFRGRDEDVQKLVDVINKQ